jgi:secreted trypsin-like serine protease
MTTVQWSFSGIRIAIFREICHMKLSVLIFLVGVVVLALATELSDTVDTAAFERADGTFLRGFGRIVNGSPVAQGTYPWMAKLNINGQFLCGGSVIAANYILTAAHCVRDNAGNTYSGNQVVATVNCANSAACPGASEQKTSSAIYVHVNYNSQNYENDVAIVYFGTGFTVTPIDVISASTKDAVCSGKEVTVAGYGTTSSGGTTSATLLQVSLKMYSRSECKKYMSGIYDNMICAGDIGEARDSCQGDSGGPLFGSMNGKYVLVGDVSWGDGCAKLDKLGVYGNLLSFETGIKSILAGGTSFIAGTSITEPSCNDVSSSSSASNDDGEGPC